MRGSKVTFESGTERRIAAEEDRLRSDSLALATLPKLPSRQGAEEVRKIADLFTTLRVFDVNVRAAREPSAVLESELLSADGANLASFLGYLRERHASVWQMFLADARELLPGLRDIVLRPVGGASAGATIELDERGLVTRTELGEASYGTIRLLSLLALLHDPNPPPLTAIEEFDHGLHPHVFDLLVDRLRLASERSQFILATHSPALVNRLRAEELIVCERDPSTGASRIPAVDSATIKSIEKASDGQFGLGEIWFSGVLGGVPG